MIDVNQAWEILLEELGVSEETLQVVTCINGYSLETMEAILFATEGYRCFEQLDGYDDDDDDE